MSQVQDQDMLAVQEKKKKRKKRKQICLEREDCARLSKFDLIRIFLVLSQFTQCKTMDNFNAHNQFSLR